MKVSKEKYAVGKTTGLVVTDKDSSEKEVFIRYSRTGELETLSIGDDKTVQFIVSYRVVKEIIEKAK